MSLFDAPALPAKKNTLENSSNGEVGISFEERTTRIRIQLTMDAIQQPLTDGEGASSAGPLFRITRDSRSGEKSSPEDRRPAQELKNRGRLPCNEVSRFRKITDFS